MAFAAHWVNGQEGGSLSADDRGFAYGDGVFETFRCHAGSIFNWPLHRERLARGLSVLGIDCSLERVEQQLQQGLRWLRDNGLEQAAGRLAVSRGSGPRGYRPGQGVSTLVLSLGPIAPWREAAPPLTVVVCDTTLSRQPRLAGIKHSNRLEQVLAARELESRAAGEGLMLNDLGELACAVSANVFIVSSGELLTPPVRECGVAGTVRRLVMDSLAPALGLGCTEQVLRLADLEAADELLLTNATLGIRSVASCEGLSFTSTECGDNLRERFFSWSETTG